ncbi:hypothetical protein [Sphingopyxis sp. 113P3]|uniref:hypothetical protein n=1 Tax=Sphingopyxis sp. (strain 113P3) TaxID=292913 RepID=UPI0006AD482A|nr:hypothetical protein [Sphingopyxis sp. 113P3]ALC11244.1 hypothetical protein LH20_04685 [Sphingopyxis sp. 113P3]
MITNILFALGGSIAGFLVCAFFTAGKLADLGSDDEALAAYARCADSQSLAIEKLRAIRSIIAGNKTVRTSRIAEVIGE